MQQRRKASSSSNSEYNLRASSSRSGSNSPTLVYLYDEDMKQYFEEELMFN